MRYGSSRWIWGIEEGGFFEVTLKYFLLHSSLTLNRQASLTGFVTCATLSLTYYSRGSEQRSKQSNHRLGYPPMTPSAAPGAGLTLFEVHIYDHMAKVCFYHIAEFYFYPQFILSIAESAVTEFKDLFCLCPPLA